uniref:Uncharacterized protein n=1 Tax=Globodera rostochiensis TaxID=31243 RepID=A0A914IHG3_GLORO
MISLHPLGGIRKSLVQFQLQLLTRPRIGVNHSRAKRPPIVMDIIWANIFDRGKIAPPLSLKEALTNSTLGPSYKETIVTKSLSPPIGAFWDFDEFDAPENIVHFLERISLSISGSFIQSP